MMVHKRLACWALLCVLGAFPPFAEDETTSAQVTYVTGASVYLNAGREEGLSVGARLVLVRGPLEVATLEVTELSSHRAACRILSRTGTPAVGDTVTFRPRDQPSAPVAVSALPTEPDASANKRRGEGLRAFGLRGRIGLRFLAVDNHEPGSTDYSQPALDLRLDGQQIAGTGWGLAVDVRSRRTYRDRAGGARQDSSRTRVYRMAVSHATADGPWQFTAGRQYSPALSAVSVFDGVSAAYRGAGFEIGALSGTQPDPLDYGHATDVREHGLYVRFRGRPAPRRTWSVTSGLIGSYQASEVNREFVYLQGQFSGPKLSTFMTQEVDYNRGWKVDAGEDTIEPTSTYLNLGYRVGQALTLRGGYDNRRNVRLYRDRVTPDTEFDDTFRRGTWVGAHVRLKQRFGVGFDLRSNRRAAAGDANTYTATFGARALTPWKIHLRSRLSRFENDWQEGWLYSLSGGLDLGSRTQIRLGAGRRDEENLLRIPAQASLNWYSLDLDLSLGPSWYLLVSGERTDGDQEQVDQFYTSLSYRF